MPHRRQAPQLALAAFVLLRPLPSCHHSASPPHTTAPDHTHELHLPPVGAAVTVRLDGKSTDVALTTLPRSASANVVPLLEVWRAAYPAQDAAPLHFDLVGSDGFRPMSRSKCTHLLSGDEIAQLHIDVVTHDITVDPPLALPGCYRVRAVVAIEAVR